MNTKYVIGTVVLVVVVIGILVSGGKKEIVTPASSTETIVTTTNANITPVATVTYDTNGFTPSKVTVKVGDIVRFVNKTTREMEVASNPHPTHTDYPAFDQGKGAYDKQNTFNFTFTKVGIWGYHNHESARDRGEIIVQ